MSVDAHVLTRKESKHFSFKSPGIINFKLLNVMLEGNSVVSVSRKETDRPQLENIFSTCQLLELVTIRKINI